MTFISKSTFHNVFEKLGPSIERVYKKHQLVVFEAVKSAYEVVHIMKWKITYPEILFFRLMVFKKFGTFR